jgi:hypothetical protein
MEKNYPPPKGIMSEQSGNSFPIFSRVASNRFPDIINSINYQSERLGISLAYYNIKRIKNSPGK